MGLKEQLDKLLIERPPRWFRILAAGMCLVQMYGLIAGVREAQWDDVLWQSVVLILLANVAIAPRALYDGRSTAFEHSHPVLSGSLVTAFVGTGVMALLADRLGYGLSALVAFPAAAVLVFGSAALRRPKQKGSPPG
jgi:CDP-diglyceride synthetase